MVSPPPPLSKLVETRALALADLVRAAAAFFTSYETLKVRLPQLFPKLGSEEFAPALHMLSASGGEVVSRSPSEELGFCADLALSSQTACLIRVPTEVVKQRSQTASKGTGSWAVAKSVWSASGVKGFYRGFGSTVAREVSPSRSGFELELTTAPRRSPSPASSSPCTSG